MPIMLWGWSWENLSRCYLWDQLLVWGNCKIIEQFDMKTIWTRYNMYKQWYSIKSIQVQESQYCWYNSTRWKWCITFVEKQNTNLWLSIMWQV